MKTEIIDKLPAWHKDLTGKDSIITGDLDGLMGHYFLNKKFGCNCRGFYDFKDIYFVDDNLKKLFAIDLDVLNEKTFGNHITHFYKNPKAINLNNIYNLKYYKKFPFSTTILILSLYNFDLESMTDEQLKIILAIDSGYLGYYTVNSFFKDIYIKWLERLDIRFLEDRILKNMTVAEFAKITKQYNLKGNIVMGNDGHLATSIYLDKLSEIFDDIIELPDGEFKKYRSFQYKVINPNYQIIPDREKIFSMAWTRKNELRMSLKI